MDHSTQYSRLLKNLPRISIGVVGDFCLDAYWQLDATRTEASLETRKPTLAVAKQAYSLGGAGNVAANASALAVRRIHVFGIITNDMFGREMLRQMRDLRFHVGGMVRQDDRWQTPVYAKPYLGISEQNRIDFGRYNVLSPKSERQLIATLREEMTKVDAVIVNQQLPKSIFTPRVVKTLNTLAKKYPEKTFLVDSRHRLRSFRSMVCKLNAVEAAGLFGEKALKNELVSRSDLQKYSRHFFRQFRKPVYITRGRRGLFIFDGDDTMELPALTATGTIDPVGAGDTVVAALAASLAAGVSPVFAGQLAMLAAAVTVQKLRQTGTATPREILNLAKSTRPG